MVVCSSVGYVRLRVGEKTSKLIFCVSTLYSRVVRTEYSVLYQCELRLAP